MRPIVTTVALVASVLAAQAQDCDNATDQRSFDVCAGKQFEAADKELNKDFREIQARLAGEAEMRKLLVDAQRAWISFRDTECAFQASGVAGGSVYPMTLALCKASLTSERVKQLRSYLACEDGDLNCPVPRANE